MRLTFEAYSPAPCQSFAARYIIFREQGRSKFYPDAGTNTTVSSASATPQAPFVILLHPGSQIDNTTLIRPLVPIAWTAISLVLTVPSHPGALCLCCRH